MARTVRLRSLQDLINAAVRPRGRSLHMRTAPHQNIFRIRRKTCQPQRRLLVTRGHRSCKGSACSIVWLCRWRSWLEGQNKRTKKWPFLISIDQSKVACLPRPEVWRGNKGKIHAMTQTFTPVQYVLRRYSAHTQHFWLRLHCS